MGDGAVLQREDCEQIVRKLEGSSDFQVTKYSVEPFRHQMLGLTGEHFTLRIEFSLGKEVKTHEFFVKTLSTNPLLTEFTKALQVYEKEKFFYGLLEEFSRYEIDTSFAPRGFFFKPYVIVLEDVAREGYESTPKRQLLDLEHCEICLDTIAQFHASGIVYEKRKSAETGSGFSLSNQNVLLEDKFARPGSTAAKFVQAGVVGLFQLIDLIPENHISGAAFKAKLLELLEAETPTEGLVNSILHADVWTSNFLYLYDKGKPVKSKLLDFQLLKYGPVESDVAEFLMTNTSRSLHEKHYEVLVEYYYNALSRCLGEYRALLPICGDFVDSCNRFKVAGKIHAAVDHCYTFESDEVFAKVLKSEDGFGKFLFEERGKYAVEAFKSNTAFKEMLQEDLLVLRDLLFST